METMPVGYMPEALAYKYAEEGGEEMDRSLYDNYVSIQNKSFLPGEGIIKGDIEETIKSMGYIGRVGMRSTDTEILNIMIDRIDVDQVC